LANLESIKVYWYDIETPEWVQVTGIASLPLISKRMDTFSICTITISDFEGSLYSTWEGRDFVEIKIEDSSANILFQGYLKRKDFSANLLSLTIDGFATKLDWTPFNQNFILASGLVKSVSWDYTDQVHAINATNQPYGLAFDLTNIFVVSLGDEKVYYYNTDFVLLGSFDISASIDVPTDIYHMHDTSKFYIISNGDSKINRYSQSLVYEDAVDVSAYIDNGVGIAFDGVYFYIVDQDNVDITKFTSAWEHVETIPLTGATTPACIEYRPDDLSFYVTELSNNTIRRYDKTFTFIEAFSMTATDEVYGICWTGHHFLVVNLTEENIYILMPTVVDYEDYFYMECKQDDEDAGNPPFAWDDREWVGNRNVGLLIQDNTQGNVTVTYDVSALWPTQHAWATGNVASTQAKNDDNYYAIGDSNDTGATDAYMDIEIDGAVIPVAYNLQSIRVYYRFGALKGSGHVTAQLQIKYETTYITIAQVSFARGGLRQWGFIEGFFDILSGFSHYLDTTGANYDALKGMRLKFYDSSEIYEAELWLDYLSVDITYNVDDISPVMFKIHDSGTTFLACCDTDFGTNGVQINDLFNIGENTRSIVGSIEARILIPIIVDSTLSKYMARNFQGNNCTEVLRAICQLEGLHWAEDHANKRIVIAKSEDFEPSGITLTSASYDSMWVFEDNCNHYKGVWVHGNATLGIEYKVEDPSSTSLLWRQVADDTIMTNADAKTVCDSLFAELENKRPSVKLSVTDTDGSYAALEAMKTVTVTQERPTIAEIDYPIRRLDIQRIGEHLEYTLYLGLGSTPEEERIDNIIKELQYMAHKSHTDRLVNTPLGAGASITTDDIAGLESYVDAAVASFISDAVYSASWDGVTTIVPSKNTVYDKIETFDKIITPSLMSGSNGFVSGYLYGAAYNVLFSDVNAFVNASFYVKNGGSFKVRIIHVGSADNNGKTAAGNIYVSYEPADGTEEWDIDEVMSLPLGNTWVVKYHDSTTAFTVPSNGNVGINWSKTDNAGGAGGTMSVYQMVLVRQ